jgi:hypothetical protein
MHAMHATTAALLLLTATPAAATEPRACAPVWASVEGALRIWGGEPVAAGKMINGQTFMLLVSFKGASEGSFAALVIDEDGHACNIASGYRFWWLPEMAADTWPR